MHEMNYCQSNSNHSLFFKHSKKKISSLLIYVDDMILTCGDLVEVEALNNKLYVCFEIKRLSKLKYFLDIKIACYRQMNFLILTKI